MSVGEQTRKEGAPLQPINAQAFEYAVNRLFLHWAEAERHEDVAERNEALLEAAGIETQELADALARFLHGLAGYEGKEPEVLAQLDTASFAVAFDAGVIVGRLATEYTEARRRGT